MEIALVNKTGECCMMCRWCAEEDVVLGHTEEKFFTCTYHNKPTLTIGLCGSFAPENKIKEPQNTLKFAWNVS